MDMEEIKRRLAPVAERYDIEYHNDSISVHVPTYVSLPIDKIHNVTPCESTIDIHVNSDGLSVTFVLWRTVTHTHMSVLS